MARKYGPKASEKIELTLREFKRGKLKSSSGKKVKSRKQAIAIGISKARREGYKVPPEPPTSAHAIQKAQKAGPGQARHYATKKRLGKKTPRQLDREIAQSLTSSGQPQLAGLFADPAATKVFAREMRHEIQKKQAAQKTTAALAERPFSVKRFEEGRRALFGRYLTGGEARAQADKIGGWVEHEGRVVYDTAEKT